MLNNAVSVVAKLCNHSLSRFLALVAAGTVSSAHYAVFRAGRVLMGNYTIRVVPKLLNHYYMVNYMVNGAFTVNCGKDILSVFQTSSRFRLFFVLRRFYCFCLCRVAANALERDIDCPLAVRILPAVFIPACEHDMLVPQGLDLFGLGRAAHRAGVSPHALPGAGRLSGHFAVVPGVGSGFDMGRIILTSAGMMIPVFAVCPVAPAVPLGGNRLLLYQHLVTDRAVLAFGQTGLGAGRLFGLIGHFRMLVIYRDCVCLFKFVIVISGHGDLEGMRFAGVGLRILQRGGITAVRAGDFLAVQRDLYARTLGHAAYGQGGVARAVQCFGGGHGDILKLSRVDRQRVCPAIVGKLVVGAAQPGDRNCLISYNGAAIAFQDKSYSVAFHHAGSGGGEGFLSTVINEGIFSPLDPHLFFRDGERPGRAAGQLIVCGLFTGKGCLGGINALVRGGVVGESEGHAVALHQTGGGSGNCFLRAVVHRVLGNSPANGHRLFGDAPTEGLDCFTIDLIVFRGCALEFSCRGGIVPRVGGAAAGDRYRHGFLVRLRNTLNGRLNLLFLTVVGITVLIRPEEGHRLFCNGPFA